MDEGLISELIERAAKARKNSYAPYSCFSVGAALLCSDGSIYTGVNVENASYPVGICAERSAFAGAVSDGKREFKAIAIIGGRKKTVPTFPCGMCRQFMSELAGEDFSVITELSNGKYKVSRLCELLPAGFVLE